MIPALWVFAVQGYNTGQFAALGFHASLAARLFANTVGIAVAKEGNFLAPPKFFVTQRKIFGRNRVNSHK
jgi:hypothetical protein